MDSASGFVQAVITKAKSMWTKLTPCNLQRSLKLSRLSFVLASLGTGSLCEKPTKVRGCLWFFLSNPGSYVSDDYWVQRF